MKIILQPYTLCQGSLTNIGTGAVCPAVFALITFSYLNCFLKNYTAFTLIIFCVLKLNFRVIVSIQKHNNVIIQ